MSDQSPMSPPEAEPPLDRTISPIAGRLAANGRGKLLAFGGLLVGCATVALATWSAERPRSEPRRELPARQVVAFEPAKAPPTLARRGADAPVLQSGDAQVPALDPTAADAQGTPTRAGAASPRQQARHAPLMAYSRAGLSLADTGGKPLIPSLAPAKTFATELDGLRQGSTIGRVSAGAVGDRNFLILAGATIPCILQTALDTTAAGYVTCLIDRDVYSDNGAVVLLEKGSRVLGEYRTGMRQGQDRVFVLWTRAVSPQGIAIALASPASDALGRAGFGGVVDTHFWERFGAAMLLSVIDSSAAALDDDRSNGVVGVRRSSDAAGAAVRQGGDISPTLRKAQGGEVSIQVAQDLDFSAVYSLRARP